MPEKAPPKILVIDDTKELVLGLATLLKAQGYQVVAAYDALFGVSLAHKEKPDLIILDIGLPAGGGFYVLRNLKDSVQTLDIPVLVLTAQQETDLEAKVKQMGAAAYLHKPFAPESLLVQVKEILK